MESSLRKFTGLHRINLLFLLIITGLHFRLHFILYRRYRLTELLIHENVLVLLDMLYIFEIVNLFYIINWWIQRVSVLQERWNRTRRHIVLFKVTTDFILIIILLLFIGYWSGLVDVVVAFRTHKKPRLILLLNLHSRSTVLFIACRWCLMIQVYLLYINFLLIEQTFFAFMIVSWATTSFWVVWILG